MWQEFQRTLLEMVSTTATVEPEPDTSITMEPSSSSPPHELHMDQQHQVDYTHLFLEEGLDAFLSEDLAAPLFTEVFPSPCLFSHIFFL